VAKASFDGLRNHGQRVFSLERAMLQPSLGELLAERHGKPNPSLVDRQAHDRVCILVCFHERQARLDLRAA